MAVTLGVNAVFHDPAAALVVDGRVVAAVEEERLTRRKHGKSPVPFSTWELPSGAIETCLRMGGVAPSDVDIIAYSYDPALVNGGRPPERVGELIDHEWEGLRSLYASRADRFLEALDARFGGACFIHVPHHVAHAFSACAASPHPSNAVLVVDGRGEASSSLAGHWANGSFASLASTKLPDSLGLRYEELTAHLGYRRSSDEYKVMALASYGEPVHLDALRRLIHHRGDGTVHAPPIDWAEFGPAGDGDGSIATVHADLASSLQIRLEEVLLDLATWLHDHTGEDVLTLAGGVALNCVANRRIHEDGPFRDVWVQPAAGDSGTALGAALQAAVIARDPVQPMPTAALGREWSDEEIAAELDAAEIRYERPGDIADATAELLATDAVIGWFQGRSEFGPRALGHRSLLADASRPGNTERLNDIKGREQFRPIAPMVPIEAAATIFEGGPIPSPHMLFVHDVRPEWRERIPAVVHVDGTARIQTVDRDDEPLMHRCLTAFGDRTGIPVLVNTSFNTAGRPVVDSPRDALECFGSSPIDALAIGPFLVRRNGGSGR